MAEQLAVLGVLFVPLLAAVVVWILGPKQAPAVRAVSVVASVVTLALALFLAISFVLESNRVDKEGRLVGRDEARKKTTFVPEFVPGSTAEKKHETTWEILPLGSTSIKFFLGIDGLNVWLVLLTAVLMLPCVLISFGSITERANEYYAWLLALQTTMIGVFLAFDVVLFYTFFELTLVPLFFLIGIWGGTERQYAARKFFVYTLTGSLITLLGVLSVVIAVYTRTKTLTFSIPDLVFLVNEDMNKDPEFWQRLQTWVFLAMSVGFAVKVPLMPFHTWLPLAHTEAPTAGSVDLAGVLLKLGCYGFLRLCIPLTPDAAFQVGLPLIGWISALGIVYGAFCAYAQEDVKKLIAYSSVSHLGVVMLGMFSLNVTGLQGSLIQMINHGISTPMLFLLIGMLYERYHTRKMADYGGMATKFPLFAVFLVFACLSSAGMPMLNGFVGEFWCLSGVYEQQANPWRVPLTVLGASGMFLGAWYLWTMLRKVLFGPVKEPHHEGHAVKDLSPREWGMLAPLAVMCLVIGLQPALLMKVTEPDVKKVAKFANDAKDLREGKPRAEARKAQEQASASE